MAISYSTTIALAGVFQAAKLVQQLAQTGKADELAYATSLGSLLETAPADLLAVYGGEERHVELGLKTLVEHYRQADRNRDVDFTNYWISILYLEGKLHKSKQTKADLARRLQYLPTQLQHYSLQDDAMIKNFAGIYTDLISPLSRKIQINGEEQYLTQPLIQSKIRALLLAGVRSTVLWRQMGGSKWNLFFSPRKTADMAQQILSSL